MLRRILTVGAAVAFFLGVGVAMGKNYYVDAIAGNDSNLGTAAGAAWRTIGKVNGTAFAPGDSIYFRRDCVWREKLVVWSSGLEGTPIIFSAYGMGRNPLIKTSNTFSAWQLAISNGPVRVWKGSVREVIDSWGALKADARVPNYLQYPERGNRWSGPENPGDMENGYFYSPLNDGQFYYRNDAGHPGPMEIGARTCAIYLRNVHHVVVDGIDVSGPGGRDERGSKRGKDDNLVVVDASNAVTVRNGAFAHAIGGISIQNGSTNCLVQHVRVFDHASTGMYFSEAGEGNRAANCEVRDCGNLPTDFGDMGLIGIWRTPGVIIDGCHVSNNGHAGAAGIDAAISFAQSPYGLVTRSYVKGAAGTAIQFAENSDYGTAAYNIVDGWGRYGAKNSNEGIRVGGGMTSSTAINCRIYNNLLINGGATAGNWAALRVMWRENRGLQVMNNIFYGNVGVYDVYAESRDGFRGWTFSHNCYYRTSGHAVKWDTRLYDAGHIIGKKKGFLTCDVGQEKHTIIGDPMLRPDGMGLDSGSPCIDAGTYIGEQHDFHGHIVPKGKGVDIGPFEFGH